MFKSIFIFRTLTPTDAMLETEKMMPNFSEIKLLPCVPITFFFKVLTPAKQIVDALSLWH